MSPVALPSGAPAGLLVAFLADAQGDLEQFQKQLEKWFDQEMDRLSGWYKRRTQLFLLLYGILLAVLLNVDAVLVTRTLWNDPTVREAVVAEAQKAVSTSTAPPTTAAGGASPRPVPAAVASTTSISSSSTTTSCPAGGSGGGSATASGGSATTTAPDPLDCLGRRVQTLRSLQLPIGWPAWPWHWRSSYRGGDPRFPHQGGEVVLKLFGLIVTALAAAQGGPFWFDLLGKLVPLKATGPSAG